jgi:hypothetical protein
MRIRRVSAIILASTFFLGASVTTAQEKNGDNASQPPVQAGVRPGKEELGPVAESIKPYRATNRDPFRRTPRPKGPKAKNATPRNVGFPTLDARRAEFRQKVQQAVATDRPEPDPVSQYLVAEIDVTAVFRDDRGFGAFVKAQPTGTMFFIRNGSRLYNGEVVRILADEGEGSARVQFREVSYVEVGGKQSPQDRVVTKSSASGRQ